MPGNRGVREPPGFFKYNGRSLAARLGGIGNQYVASSQEQTPRPGQETVETLYRSRRSLRWRDRLRRSLTPPAPLIQNPRELQVDAPLGRWNLYIGGAGSEVPGYVNLDLFP